VRNAGYLAELLLAKGYEVFGLVRRSSTSNLERINHLTGNVQIVSGDLLDQSSLMDVVSECQPDEIYNLASQSYVPLSWTQPMWLMLQQAQPDDYTIASGETHSVKELVECAFNCVGLNWQDYVSVDPAFYRSDEAVQLVGSINKIKTGLGW
jgi:GDP-D-mannose dehydratase